MQKELDRRTPTDLSRKGKLTHGTERPSPKSAEDERRLFPGKYKEPKDGVPIIPGSYPNPKTNLKNLGFKPVDRISNNARDSGPVRAHGKQKQPRVDHLSPPYSDNTGMHGSERPSKRQRLNSSETHPARSPIIIIPSDDETGPPGMESSSMAGHSARRSSLSSQLSSRPRRMLESGPRLGSASEYREVEKSVQIPRTPSKASSKRRHFSTDDDTDEKFTKNAARERRSQPSTMDSSVKHVDDSEAPGLNGNVPKSPSREQAGTIYKQKESPDVGTNGRGGSPINRNISPSGQGHPMSPSRDRSKKSVKRPASDRGESSDELQGEVTVKPAPSKLAKERTGSASGGAQTDEARKKVIRIQSESPQPSTTEKMPRQKRDKLSKKKSKKGKGLRMFQATFFRKGHDSPRPPNGENIRLGVDTKNKMMKVYATPSVEAHTELDLNKIDHVKKGDESSRKISLYMSKSGTDDNRVDIELLSPEDKDSLISVLEKKLEAKVHGRPSDWMDSAFVKKGKQLASQPNGSKRPVESDVERSTDPTCGRVKRKRLADALKDYSAAPDREEGSPSDNELPPADPLPRASTHKGSPAPDDNQPPPLSKSADNAVTIPVKNDDDDETLPTPKPKGKLQKWHKPLVYPRFGKKKAEVDIQDLDRLRESEFLNDNLIGFYIRFLEDHLDRRNKEVSKRVYFFNSYFFATLTNLPGKQKGINYEGVEKWTRNVNLFNYDYIVVPINENAHWYVAIICNLPELQRISKDDLGVDKPDPVDERSARRKAEEQAVPGGPELAQPSLEREGSSHQDSDPGKEESARQRLASMSLSDKDLPRHGDLEAQPAETDWPAQEENLTSSPAKFSSPLPKARAARRVDSKNSRGLKASPRKPLRKSKRRPPGDVHQPAIITFDSLNLTRAPTIRALREYLRAEARSKQGLEINKTLIEGMKAREIPLQPNYSDCGLYLLAYVEKFVQDPDNFIRKLLKDEMKEKADWPRLRPGLLRARLRNFLDDLYDEQMQLSPQEASEQALMVDRQPITYLLGTLEHDAEGKDDEVEAQKSPLLSAIQAPVKSDDGRVEKATPSREPSESPKNSRDCALEPEHTNAEEAMTHDA
ncbi:hypothetical protein ATERTT37_002143 [Aspergillus terreus]